LGLQTRAIAVAHVRRIGDDEIEWTVDAVEEIGVNETDLRIDAMPRRVAPRNLECRIGKVGRDEPRDRTVVRDRYGETSAARADVSDLVARGCRRAIGDLEPNLDDELGLGPRNEHGAGDLERQPPEFVPPDDVRDGLAGGAPRDERAIARLEAGRLG